MTGDYGDVAALARARSLSIFGAFDARPDDGLPADAGTVILLGPREPGFWEEVSAAPEFSDGGADPLDRWSERVIGALAADLGGSAWFPFGGPPFRPFIRWALRSGRCWQSPAGLLVHDEAGLLVSFRGAVALGRIIAHPPGGRSPCDGCADRPCLSACPVAAMTDSGYDIAACRGYLRDNGAGPCMTGGCLARRACPVGAPYPRHPGQSAHHMRHFLR